MQGLNDLLHALSGGGRPGAVFQDGVAAVYQLVGRQIVEKLLHADEHAHIIGGGGQNDVAVLKGVGHNAAEGDHRGVAHGDGNTLLRQTAGQNIGSALRVAINGGVGNKHAPDLRLISAPQQMLMKNVVQILAPHEAVKGQEHGNVQLCRLIQHRLHLGAVLTHDVAVVAAALVQAVPVKVHLVGKEVAIESAEAAEGVRRQQELVRTVVGHHHLGPMDHGRRHKLQRMAAGAEGVSLLAHADAVVVDMTEELADHGLGHSGAEDLHIREAQHHVLQLGGVVRLHVVDHDVVQGAAIQGVVQIFPELVDHLGIHRVKQDGLFVQKQITVIGNALRHAEHALEHRQTAAVGSDPGVIIIDFANTIHTGSLPVYFFVIILQKILIDKGR